MATGSIDRSCKIWDVGSGQVLHTLTGHVDEVLDVSFNSMGTKIVSASADHTSRLYNVANGNCISVLNGMQYKKGHDGEISKALFNPAGTKILTASSDKTARIWNADESGK